MFHEINPREWPRGEMFYYFSKMAPTGYSLTAELDVTELKRVTREKGYKFFPACLWLVTRNLNKQTEFRCAEKDGKIGFYDTLTPLYAAFHEDTQTFSLMWTEFRDCFSEFHREYLVNAEKYGNVHGVLSRPEMPPENAYTVSALPWVSFSHFAVHSYENKPYYFPSVEAGKYRREGGRLLMPLSVTCHHATTDGIHVSRFLDDLQNDISNFEELIKE